jgi:hypothetical protein
MQPDLGADTGHCLQLTMIAKIPPAERLVFINWGYAFEIF